MSPSVTRNTHTIRELQRQRAQENCVLFRAVFHQHGFLHPGRRTSGPQRRNPHQNPHAWKIWKKSNQLLRTSPFFRCQRHRLVQPRYFDRILTPAEFPRRAETHLKQTRAQCPKQGIARRAPKYSGFSDLQLQERRRLKSFPVSCSQLHVSR